MDETFAMNQRICCPRCQHHSDCLRRWILGERNIIATCCSLCAESMECYESIPPEMRLDDAPMQTNESEDNRIAILLSERGYVCCPRCFSFSSCERRLSRETRGLPSYCCPSCRSLHICAMEHASVVTKASSIRHA